MLFDVFVVFVKIFRVYDDEYAGEEEENQSRTKKKIHRRCGPKCDI
jgi:hypothetical protein|tara:strand:- start:7798 stop:7935 length:138 start_codon:yes stop_codon:yes gene_type:complete